MCFELDSSPPIPPLAGAAIEQRDLTLSAADGNQFAAFFASGGMRGSPGVVILPDVRGLYRFYEELALRFAELGFDAVAIDYFGRSAGVGKRSDDFPFREHVAQTTFEGVKQDTAAALAFLREMDGGAQRSTFTVGFCFGGSNSWHQAANALGLTGAIGFYGNPTRENVPQGAPAVIDRVGEMRAPVLALMGGADEGIPVETVRRFERALADAGVEHEVQVYDGAPHSFFDRRHEEYAEASSDAWQHVMRFIKLRDGQPQ